MLNREHYDEILIAFITSIISVTAFYLYFRTGQVLLYGDAVAHIHIARRVVDSLTPGPLQLGTVWLPFPHLLMLPFIWIDRLWQSGIAGAIPSMLAYVVSSVGLYRLTKAITSKTAARLAVLIFAGNPNLIYMQSTAMTETVFLATLIWAIYYFTRFMHAAREGDEPTARRALYRGAAVFFAAVLTRYDGWFMAATAMLFVGLTFGSANRDFQRRITKPARNFMLLMAAGPALWLGYNYAIFSNPLEFATGAYSARAIAERTATKGDPPHPGQNHVNTAGVYFLKAARLNVAEGRWENVLFILAVVGMFLSLPQARIRPALLLWMLVPFYMLSVAYGGVPIFLPQWWPFSYYNVRYGLQLLPAIAIFAAVTAEVVLGFVREKVARQSVIVLFVGVVILSDLSVWSAVPISLREARVNSVTRMAFETALTAELQKLPPGSRLLMFTANHPGALQSAGIPLKRVVNEGNHRIWEAALVDPAKAVDYIIAIEGDPVAGAIASRPGTFSPIARIQTPEKPSATIYRTAGR